MTVPAAGRMPGTHAAVGRPGQILVARLGPGEDLLSGTEQLVLDAGLTAGAIVSGVASLRQVSVRNIHRYPRRWPIGDDDRHHTTVAGPVEVLAMQGNFMPAADGGLAIHCHLVFSIGSPAAATYGGHLVAASTVATTCELFLLEVHGLGLARARDGTTRAPEMVVEPAQSNPASAAAVPPRIHRR